MHEERNLPHLKEKKKKFSRWRYFESYLLLSFKSRQQEKKEKGLNRIPHT
jgi:hypothetical protein